MLFSFALLGPHRGFLDLTECAHVHDTAWVLAMVLPLFLYLHLVVIAAEEKLLSAEFGADYARMCREVPRWFLFL